MVIANLCVIACMYVGLGLVSFVGLLIYLVLIGQEGRKSDGEREKF